MLKFGAIGDVIMALPAVSALNARGVKVDWACGVVVRPLLECYSWLNILPANDKAILLGKPFERAKAVFEFWRTVGRKEYDLCATLYYDERYKVLTYPINAKQKIYLSRTDRGRMLIPGRSHTNEYARILLSHEDGYLAQGLSPVRPDRLPEQCALPPKSGLRAALVPAAAGNLLRQQTLRRWEVASYVRLARMLVLRGWEVVLLGGDDDAWVRSHFEGVPVTDCIGSLTLPMVVKACDDCDIVVSHDTGPLHLAGLSHAAVIGLFGPTDPAHFLPRRDNVVGIWGGVDLACRPCHDGVNFAPCRQNGCMSEITPEAVLHEIETLIENRASGGVSP